ncbi:MAG: hypothetical protein KatS3mg011_1442 [Acidimicrobiia bacterium]|jgi:KDO2-lipid IV(A) lauroyltransferase|nr:MAG: hypothetical protein KatS3mg011_1442 [Acidimicrobiia bacterium]
MSRRAVVYYQAFRLGMLVVGVLPMRLAQTLGRIGGALFYLGAKGRRRMARRHAARLHAARPGWQAFRMFLAYGRYWAETLWIRPHRIPLLRSRLQVEGIEWVRKAKQDGRGLICAVPHLGNWEVAGPVASEEGIRLVAVAERLPNRLITDWFVELRNRLGIEVVLTGGGSVIRTLEAALRENGAVALLCDRDLKGRGIRVEFFGEETTLPAGPASLAYRTGAPILPVAVYFTPDGGHRVVIEPPLELPSGGRDEFVKETTQRIAHALERLIRTAPEQWHLVQPNWPSDRETAR